MSVRVLIASPVRRKPAILAEFLRGLGALDLSDAAGTRVSADFAFVDDNDDPASAAMLRSWEPPCGSLRVIVPQGIPEQTYDAGNDYHRWGPELCRRVAAWRNHLAELARVDGYDAMLMVDSDLVLHPRTLTMMAGVGCDVLYEVFFTRFFDSSPWRCPNVWLWGECGQYRVYPTEPKSPTPAEVHRRSLEWFAELRQPGLHRVGGGGACTWISGKAMAAGLDWRPVTNLGWWGEDRWFQVRAEVLGFEQWADSSCPPIHLYRESDLRALPLLRARQLKGGAAHVA